MGCGNWKPRARASSTRTIRRRGIFPGRIPVNYRLLPGQKLPAIIPEDCVAPEW